MSYKKRGSNQKSKAKKPSAMELINAEFIHALESGGCLPWQRNWQASADSVSPRLGVNGKTGAPYRGMNTLILLLAQIESKYKSSTWLTYKQAQELGGQVTSAAKGKGVGLSRLYFREVEATDKNGNETVEKIPRSYPFTVFNVEHIEGLPAHLYADTEIPESEKYSTVKSFVDALGVTVVHGGNVPCLIPSTAQINMPELKSFKTEEDYWATLLHEVGHWTGIKANLGRLNTLDTAEEEAVAELFAVMSGAYFGITGDLRHEGYIKGWLERAKEGIGFLQKAIAHADKALQFALEKSGMLNQSDDDAELEENQKAA